MKKGSPEGYNAETASPEAAQKPKTGEPNDRYTLYRIRCSQEKRQLLRERCHRDDCRGRQAVGDARGAAAMGWKAQRAVARGDGGHSVQRLDLRYAEAIGSGVADGASGDDEGDRGLQEEKKTGCAP